MSTKCAAARLDFQNSTIEKIISEKNSDTKIYNGG